MHRSLVPVFLLALMAACVGDTATTVTSDGGTAAGEENGACFPNGTCNAGLVCIIPNKCVKPAVDIDGGSDTGVPDAAVDAPTNPCPTSANLAYWKAENNATDERGSFNLVTHGTIVYPPGHAGTAFAFPGEGTIWLESDTRPAPTELTIEAWIFPENVASGIIFSGRASGGSGVELALSAGALQLSIRSITVTSSGTALTVGAWHHVAATINSTTVTLYIEGAPAGSGSSDGPPALDANMRVGLGWGPAAEPFHGDIDDLALYGKALPLSAIFDLYSGGAKCK